MNTQELLIADENLATRKQMADLFVDAGYQVTAPASVAGALNGILKKTVKVVLLSMRFDELLATEVIPLLKQCNRDLTIILVAGELPLALLRKARHEGIFYHALKPEQPADEEELRQVVKCAFKKANKRRHNDALSDE
ncbi:MAG: response regulator [Desulfuromonadales bacterium]|nr:response regulator [Desulfuromonadales bacterium]